MEIKINEAKKKQSELIVEDLPSSRVIQKKNMF